MYILTSVLKCRVVPEEEGGPTGYSPSMWELIQLVGKYDDVSLLELSRKPNEKHRIL
jgi:hypothetical protein